MKIGFIGGGNMATALIAGLLAKSFTPQQLIVAEINPDARTRLHDQYKVDVTNELSVLTAHCSILVLAVKPQQLKEVSAELAPLIKDQLIVSIAAGIRTDDLSRWLGTDNIVRVMPNTPSLIQQGMAGMYAMPRVGQEQRELATQIMLAVGQVLWLDQEDKIDGVTAISGSGPAYVFYLIEALQLAAQEQGFTPEEARQLCLATFLGASQLAATSQEDVSVLRQRVTSKNGTTYAALCSLTDNQITQHISQAVQAAATRSREMAEEFGRSC